MTASGRPECSSTAQWTAGVPLDGSVVAAIAAVAGCFVVTVVFSLLAVAVHRRAETMHSLIQASVMCLVRHNAAATSCGCQSWRC